MSGKKIENRIAPPSAKAKTPEPTPEQPKVIATESFQAQVSGYLERFTAGETIIDADHPVAREFPDRFAPVRRDRPLIEDASADPGRKRGT